MGHEVGAPVIAEEEEEESFEQLSNKDCRAVMILCVDVAEVWLQRRMRLGLMIPSKTT